ncbi:MAG: formyltransferase family protein [Pseudomonadota bacterium]
MLPHLADGVEALAIVRASIRPAQSAEMERLAAAGGKKMFVQPKAKSADYSAFLADMKSFDPDLILINSYSMILSPDVLAIPRGGAINVHGALLPQYRGANVTEWALINEECQSGVTMHRVDAGIDTGAIVDRESVPLHFEDTWIDARARINRATDVLLKKQLPLVLAGQIDAKPQDESQAHHWHRRRPEDGRFEWHWPLRRIYNLVRALVAPHPGAWYEGNGRTEVLDRWLSLPKLAELKSRIVGEWRYGSAVLTPRTSFAADSARESANASFAFDVSGTSAGLASVDYRNGTARAVVNNPSANSEILSALIRFAEEELFLKRVETSAGAI